MEKIIDCGLSRFSNQEHYKVVIDFDSLLTRHSPAMLGVASEYQVFKDLLADEGTALNLIRKNNYTERMKLVVDKRNLTIDGLNDAIKSGQNHYDSTVQAAFKRIKTLWDANSDVKAVALNTKEGAIQKVVMELNGNYRLDVTSAGLQGWVDTLTVDHAACLETENSRDAENENKTTLRMREVRKQIDAMIYKIIEKVNAQIIVLGEQNFTDFVKALNERLRWHNNSLAIRKADRKKGTDETVK